MNTEVYNIYSNLVTAPITLNHSFDLGWIPVGMMNYFTSIQWTGTPTGYFNLQCSGERYLQGSDITPPKGFPFFMREQLQNPTTSFVIAGSQYNVSAAGSNAWNVGGANYSFIKIVYTDQSSGASTAQLTFANLNQKG